MVVNCEWNIWENMKRSFKTNALSEAFKYPYIVIFCPLNRLEQGRTICLLYMYNKERFRHCIFDMIEMLETMLEYEFCKRLCPWLIN